MKTWQKIVIRLCVGAVILAILIDSGLFLRTEIHPRGLL